MYTVLTWLRHLFWADGAFSNNPRSSGLRVRLELDSSYGSTEFDDDLVLTAAPGQEAVEMMDELVRLGTVQTLMVVGLTDLAPEQRRQVHRAGLRARRAGIIVTVVD